MARTYDQVDVAVAYQKYGGDRSQVTEEDRMTMASRLGLILTLGKQISINDERMFKRGKSRLDAAESWRDSQQKLRMNLAQFSKTKEVDLYRAGLQAYERSVAKSERLLGDLSEPDIGYFTELRKQAVNNSADGMGLTARAWFNAAVDTNPFQLGEGVATYNLSKPEMRAAQLAAFERINTLSVQKGGPTIFKIDPTTKEILNIDDLQNPKSGREGGFLHGLMTPAQISSVLGKEEGPNQLTAYNTQARKAAATKGSMSTHIEGMKSLLGEMKKPDISIDEMGNLLAKSEKAVSVLEDVAESQGTFNIRDMEELQTELKDYSTLEKQNEILRNEQAKLVALGDPDTIDKFTKDMAHGISSPQFRAWAADHGFDEIGRVDVDGDNRLRYDTYVQGRDDLAAAHAYRRELNRGAGRYGFQNIGTGEIVQVTMDGQTITGERLKFHAADRPGVVRIAVPGGDNPVITISPGDVDRIEVIARNPERESPLERRARKFLTRRGDAITEAGAAARGEPALDEADAAVVGDDFIVDGSGRNLSEAEYDKMVSDKVASTKVVAKHVDDGKYLVGSDDKVYRVSEDTGALTLVDPEEKDGQGISIADRVLAADPRDAAFGVASADGESLDLVAVSSADLKAGKMPDGAQFLSAPLAGEANFDNEELQKAFADTEAGRAQSVTPESLNLKRSGAFKAQGGQEFSNERSIGGMKFVDLTSPPSRAALPSEPGKEADEAVAMNQATFDALPPDQQDAIDVWTAEYKAAPANAKPSPPEGYEVVQGVGLRPKTETLAQVKAQIEGSSESVDLRGEPIPSDPEPVGVEVADKSQDQPDVLPPPPPKPPDVVTDETARSVVDDIIEPPPSGITPPTDAEFDAMIEDPEPTKPAPTPESVKREMEAVRRSAANQDKPAELPLGVAAALDATPEGEAQKAADAEDKKAKGQALKDAAKRAEGIQSLDVKGKLEAKTEPVDENKNEKKRAKLGDVIAQLVTPKKFAAKQEEEKQESLEGLPGALGGMFEQSDDAGNTDGVQIEGQNKVKGTPIVPGQNTEPQTTPETPDPDEVAARKAKIAEQLAAMRANKERLNIGADVDTSGSPVPNVDIGGQQ